MQGNHLHLVVEADSDVSLPRALQGLCIRIARALNAMMGRRAGSLPTTITRVLLRSPPELLRAIRYVLGNGAHHFGAAGTDPRSSAALVPAERQTVLAPAAGWLLRAGLARLGPC